MTQLLVHKTASHHPEEPLLLMVHQKKPVPRKVVDLSFSLCKPFACIGSYSEMHILLERVRFLFSSQMRFRSAKQDRSGATM